jgi:hypothetical protein
LALGEELEAAEVSLSRLERRDEMICWRIWRKRNDCFEESVLDSPSTQPWDVRVV